MKEGTYPIFLGAALDGWAEVQSEVGPQRDIVGGQYQVTVASDGADSTVITAIEPITHLPWDIADFHVVKADGVIVASDSADTAASLVSTISPAGRYANEAWNQAAAQVPGAAQHADSTLIYAYASSDLSRVGQGDDPIHTDEQFVGESVTMEHLTFEGMDRNQRVGDGPYVDVIPVVQQSLSTQPLSEAAYDAHASYSVIIPTRTQTTDWLVRAVVHEATHTRLSAYGYSDVCRTEGIAEFMGQKYMDRIRGADPSLQDYWVQRPPAWPIQELADKDFYEGDLQAINGRYANCGTAFFYLAAQGIDPMTYAIDSYVLFDREFAAKYPQASGPELMSQVSTWAASQ